MVGNFGQIKGGASPHSAPNSLLSQVALKGHHTDSWRVVRLSTAMSHDGYTLTPEWETQLLGKVNRRWPMRAHLTCEHSQNYFPDPVGTGCWNSLIYQGFLNVCTSLICSGVHKNDIFGSSFIGYVQLDRLW